MAMKTEMRLIDLGEVKKSEREVTILNSLSEEIAHMDTDMRLVWVNEAASKSAGSTRGKIIGCHCYDIWCKNGEPRMDCPVAGTIRTGQPQEGEISTPDGRIWLHRSYPVRDEKGNIAGAVRITSEITERKQAEKALRAHEEAYRTLAQNLP
jgi:PAS domain S-box-containing protein